MFKSRNLEIADENNGTESKVTRRCSRYSWYEWITVFSSLFVPLIVGILTVVLPLQQSNLNEQQQENVKSLALKNRLHDMEIFRDQQKQTILNNYEQDLSKLILLYKNIDLKTNDELENYPDSEYIESDQDGDDEKISKVIRTKTLNAIRQLDPARKMLLILLLIDSEILHRINLSQTDLSSTVFPPGSNYHHLQFSRLIAKNLSLKSVAIHHSDFTYSTLDGSSFDSSNCSFTDFSYASLKNTDWTNADVTQVVFNYTNLFASNITEFQLSKVQSLYGSILPNGSRYFQ